MKIVDTHQHLIYPEKFTYPWLGGEGLEALQGRFAVEDYGKAVGHSRDIETIFMEVDVKEDQQTAEADFMCGLAKDAAKGMRAVIASGRPENPEFRDHLDSISHPSLRGMRRIFHVLDRLPLGSVFTRNIQLLGEKNLVFDICARPNQLVEISSELVRNCPDTRFVLDHCGNPPISSGNLSEWKQGIEEIAKQGNVFCKVSGLVTHCEKGNVTPKAIEPVFRYVFDLFGPGRLLFGGDWPVCNLTSSLGEWIEIAESLTEKLSNDEKESFWSRNAKKIYRLP